MTFALSMLGVADADSIPEELIEEFQGILEYHLASGVVLGTEDADELTISTMLGESGLSCEESDGTLTLSSKGGDLNIGTTSL